MRTEIEASVRTSIEEIRGPQYSQYSPWKRARTKAEEPKQESDLVENNVTVLTPGHNDPPSQTQENPQNPTTSLTPPTPDHNLLFHDFPDTVPLPPRASDKPLTRNFPRDPTLYPLDTVPLPSLVS